MNALRKISRHSVKALAAGAVLIAAALPVAIATEAGAATAATLTGAFTQGAQIATGTITGTATSGSVSLVISDTTATNDAFPVGTIVVGAGIPAGDYVTAQSAITGNGPYGSTLTLAAAATATGGPAITVFTPVALPTFGAGGTGTVYFSGTGFAANGSTTTLTSAPAGVTFSSASETSAALGSATYSVAGTAPVGFYSLTLTDGFGTTNTLASAFQVSSAPTIASISPTTLVASTTKTVTITGSGFVTGAQAVLTSTVDGTSLTSSASSVISGTTMTVSVNATNAVSGAATVGTYAVTVTNPDTGSVTSAGLLTVTAFGITSVTPSYIADPTGGTTSVITINGNGFGTAPVVGFSADITISGVPTVNAAGTVITVPVNVAYVANALIDVSATNTQTGLVATLASAIGLNEASTIASAAPVVTGTSAPTLGVGSNGYFSITGTGFAPGSGGQAPTVTVYSGATGTTTSNVTCGAAVLFSSTSMACTISAVGANAIAGADSITVTNNGGFASANFANALTVAGPVITSATPASVGVGFAGTITLTGTGFTSKDTVGAASGLSGTGNATPLITYVSPTEEQILLPTAGTGGAALTVAGAVTISVSSSNSSTTTSPAFKISAAGSNPVISGAPTYSASTLTGIGAGGSSTVVFNGTGFLPGATVTFAQAGITAAVTAVTNTAIKATVTVASTVPATTYAYTVSNTNGGFVLSSGANDLTVDAAPVVTIPASTSSTAVRAGTTTTVVLTGTGFVNGIVASSTSSLLTVGTAVINANGTLSVPVTAVTINGTSSIAATLVLTNLDGGSSTTALTVNPAPSVTPGTYTVPNPSTNAEVTILGTGFETGMTAATTTTGYTVSVGSVTPTLSTGGSSLVLLVTSTSSAPATVALTNPDGGTVSFTLNAAAVTPPPPPVTGKKVPFTNGTHGSAVVGKTVSITITGGNFYGAPKITSNASGTSAVVSKDSGTSLTVRVTVKAGSAAGEHTLTITLADGKSCKANYKVIK